MVEEGLRFPDASHSELEDTIGDLLDRAGRVLAAQGRLRSLLMANRVIVDGLELDEVLGHITEAAIGLVSAEYGALGVIGPDGGLERFIHVGISAEEARSIGHLPTGRGLLGAVIDGDGPIRLEDIGADPRSVGFPPHHPPMCGFLGVPIRVRGEAYGTLYLANRAGSSFSAEDEELVVALAATAGVAIDNARMYEEARRRQRLSTAISEVAAALLAPDAGDAFDVVAERVASLSGADLVTVVVPRSSERFGVAVARGVGAHAIEGTILSGGDSIVARVIAGGRIVTSHDDIDGLPFEERLAGGSTIAVPLVVSGVTVGALCVTRGADGSSFSAVDLETVSEFAGQAGLAVALAWARADRQRLAVIEERARIARDLHDQVIQRLFGAGLGLQALAEAVPEHAATLGIHIDEIDAAIADIRTAVFTLRSRNASASTRHRILDAVSESTQGLRATPRVTFAGPVDLLVVGELADDVVAVVRETLSNVARHANAESTAVDVTVSRLEVVVLVEDDGVGIPERIRRRSGIANLGERARARGGGFTLERRQSGGTRARWHVPFAMESEASA